MTVVRQSPATELSVAGELGNAEMPVAAPSRNLGGDRSL